MKKFTASLFISLVICLAFSIISNANQVENMASKFIRLHVVADSNSQEDQELKLKVRDKALEIVTNLTEKCADKEQSEKVINSSLNLIESELQGYCNRKVKVSYGMAYIDRRDYDSFSLPAGRYSTLKIEIGEAKGNNWWCVLFPSLCSSCAVDIEEASVFTKGEIQILSKPKTVKYKLFCYELISKIKAWAVNEPKLIKK